MRVDHPGFASPVADAQTCFRAVLDAMSHPGRVVPIAGLRPPPPLAPATAAVLLTLADADTPVFLDQMAAAAGDWVRFHCGAALVPEHRASFVVCLALPPLDGLASGSHDGPEASATVILQHPTFETGPLLRLSGPGLAQPATVCLGPLPDDFATRWQPNHAAFPRGVDLILCAGSAVAALPRSTRVEPA